MISPAFCGSAHDFRILKEFGFTPAALKLLGLMKDVIVWADSAYGALQKIFPEWEHKIHKKGKRNHPLSELDKRNNRAKSKNRIYVEHTIGRLKKFNCCQYRARNVSEATHATYWNVVAGICNLQKAQELQISQIFGYDL